MHENLQDTNPISSWIIVFIFSIWGGFAQYLNTIAKSKRKFIEEEMETHLKGGVEESLPIILEE